MTAEHDLPIVRACQIARLSRAAYYKPGIDRMARDAEVITALQAIVVNEQRWGFWKCHDRLRAKAIGLQRPCIANPQRDRRSQSRGLGHRHRGERRRAVIRFLTQMIDLHCRPSAIHCDNGPELASGARYQTGLKRSASIDLAQLPKVVHDDQRFGGNRVITLLFR
jgi:hypothetical protein